MNTRITIGIIKEGKNPPDRRTPFTPEQCREIMQEHDHIEIIVQSSAIRCYSDDEYRKQGVKVCDSVATCDVLMGIKEVKPVELIGNKTYFFFSHTIKKQPHNQQLLSTLLSKQIRMIDYETLCYKDGGRIIGFGRYAGIVGTYNAMRLYAEKHLGLKIKPAHICDDRFEMENELEQFNLPKNYKIVITGSGRVGNGCMEILKKMNIRQVSAQDFLTLNFDQPVFTQLHVDDYNRTCDNSPFDRDLFYHNPTANYCSDFLKYAFVADMYIACHFWDQRSPKILSANDLQNPNLKLKIIADISCDVAAPIASTLRASTIDLPFYGYDVHSCKETDFMLPQVIAVMAVDNLPCELPKNASQDFGKALIKYVIPSLIDNDKDEILLRATICEKGKLSNRFSYLEDYAATKVN